MTGNGMGATGRVILAMATGAIAVAGAAAAGAARPGTIAERSRGTVTITASVAARTQLSGDGAGLCLWSNTATRLVKIVTAGAGIAAPIVAAPAPGCAAGGRLVVDPAATTRAILVSPE